ncbi:hypothetical protein ACW0US_18050 [Xanthomonas euvesicatoria]
MRRHYQIVAGMGLAVLLYHVPAQAMDAATKQAICDEIQKSAQDALKKNVENYTPRTDPSTTFNTATQACLNLIVQYNKIPMSWVRVEALQPILQELGRQLLTKSCDSAKAQFEKTIKDALADNGLTYNTSTGSVSYSAYSSDYGSGSVSVDTSGNVTTSGSGTAGGLLNVGP